MGGYSFIPIQSLHFRSTLDNVSITSPIKHYSKYVKKRNLTNYRDRLKYKLTKITYKLKLTTWHSDVN